MTMTALSTDDFDTAPAPRDRQFLLGGRQIATLSPQGRIRINGHITLAVRDIGYTTPPPSDRLLDALARLLAQDLTIALGHEVVEV